MQYMSNIVEKIIKKDELFLSLAEKLTEEQREKQRIARRKWYKRIMEIGKENPNDPRYLDYLNKTKERKLLEKEVIESDPELKIKHLENLKLRQQKWREKQNPEKFTQQSKEKWSKVKELQSTDPLKFLLINLGRQVAFRRKDEKNKNNPESLELFEKLASRIMMFRDNINIIIKQERWTDSVLSALINEGQKLGSDLSGALPAISKTINAIVNELNIIYDKIKNF